MKKIISVIVILSLILVGCQSGISPKTPTSKVEEKQEELQEDKSEDLVDLEEPLDAEVEPETEALVEETLDAEEALVKEALDTEESLEQEEVLETEEEELETVDEKATGEIEAPVIGETEDVVQESLPIIKKPLVKTSAIIFDEIRAVWLSYLDLQPMFASKTEGGYRQEITIAMDQISDLGMNTVMYQVRPFGDALYQSSLFPSSYIVTGVEGARLSFDPFEIAVEIAHEKGLRIEAWINPYRIRNANSKIALSSNNIAKTWAEDDSRRVLKTKEGALSFNPGNQDVEDYIVSGVQEIINHYAVDGIHFDDYFYPTTDALFDEVDYLAYQYNAATMTQEDYRRMNVNELIENVYKLIHSYDRDLVFGISPVGNVEINYSQLYADVPLWVGSAGYVDYISPQVYFGFEHEYTPYEEVMDEWAALIKTDVDLIAGLAVYKIGVEDQWAGSGGQEWIESQGILKKMIETAKKDSHYSGYALYRYGFLFPTDATLVNQMIMERQGIIETLNE